MSHDSHPGGSNSGAHFSPLIQLLKRNRNVVARFLADHHRQPRSTPNADDLAGFAPTADPRPDLEEDSHLWQQVLEVASELNPDIHAVLHGFRCMGCRLVNTEAGLRMEPRIDDGESPQRYGFDSEADYQRERSRWLIPVTDEVVEIFRQAKEPSS
jgi:hypothetical protein